MNINTNIAHRRESGVALVVGMIILLVMTVIGVTGIQSSVLEEKMVGNVQDKNVALQIAEGALREAELRLSTLPLPAFNNTGGFYIAPAAPEPSWQNFDWENSDQVAYTKFKVAAPGSLALANGSFIIEELPRVRPRNAPIDADTVLILPTFYRVTARGVGTSGNAVVILQTTFMRFNT